MPSVAPVLPEGAVLALGDLLGRVPPRVRCIVGVAGEPGAGKSTLATLLAQACTAQGRRAVVVPMDGFHLSNAELHRLGRRDRKGAIDTFDGWGYLALLRRLRSPDREDVIYAPAYERDIEESVGSVIAVTADHDVIITEGNYLLADQNPWRDVRDLVDEVWWIETDGDLRRQRLLTRHTDYGKDPAHAAIWVQEVDEPNAARIRATAASAHRHLSW